MIILVTVVKVVLAGRKFVIDSTAPRFATSSSLDESSFIICSTTRSSLGDEFCCWVTVTVNAVSAAYSKVDASLKKVSMRTFCLRP